MARTELQLHKIAIEVQAFLEEHDRFHLLLNGGYPAIIRKVGDCIVIASTDGGVPTLAVFDLEEAFWRVRYAKRQMASDKIDIAVAWCDSEIAFQDFYAEEEE